MGNEDVSDDAYERAARLAEEIADDDLSRIIAHERSTS
jgi:hypothetical protein